MVHFPSEKRDFFPNTSKWSNVFILLTLYINFSIDIVEFILQQDLSTVDPGRINIFELMIKKETDTHFQTTLQVQN